MKNKHLFFQILLGLFFIVVVILPLIEVLTQIKLNNVLPILSSKHFMAAVKNSIYYSGIATFISVILGWLTAYTIERTNIRYKTMFTLILTIPMLIPSISHGMGLILLLGTNGILTNFLHLHFSIYGALGIVLGSVLYSFPVAFLMFYDVLRYENAAPYEAAEILGINKLHQIKILTLPYLRRPLISIIFATFTLIVTDYGVPLMIGGNVITLPVMMYQEVIGLLDFSKGSLIGSVLLIPAVIAFLFDLMNKDSFNQTFITQKFAMTKNKLIDTLSSAFLFFMSICVLLPIASFIVLSFVKKYPLDMTWSLVPIQKTILLGGINYLANSLLIAFFVAILGTTIAFITAYLSGRFSGKAAGILHLISILSLAIPGIVLGLSYVLFFKGSFIYGTFAILILVNTIHFFASPYLMMYNSMKKINNNIEDVGMILGINRLHLILHVILPQSRNTLSEMFVYFFVNSMMTISAVSFLSSVDTKPLALMMNQFEANMMLECSAVVSLVILIVNLLIKVISLKLENTH
jgi:iron(III) transport system permease protein